MPTASELVDNRAIVARIHRRRHPSEDDGDSPLMPSQDHQDVSSHGYFVHLPHEQPTEESSGRNDESPNLQNVVRQYEDQVTARAVGGRERRPGGKWPRQKYIFNSSSVLKPGYRKRYCEAENCVHQYGSSCVDILLQPHLYPHICKSKGLAASSNPLLEYCLDGAGQLKNAENDRENTEQLSPLLEICSSFSSSNFSLMPNTTCFNTTKTTNNTAKENELDNGRTRTLDNLPASHLNNLSDIEDELATNVATNKEENPINTYEDQSNAQVFSYLEGQLICQAESGCDINVQNSSGFTALHFLINGCSKENFPHILRAVSLLIRQPGINVSLEDIQGNTPFNAIQSLLHRGLYRQSFLIAKCLLQNSNCDVNHVNLEGRSLLSHSVCHGDNSIDLSRLLLNNGAKIFPTRAIDSRDNQYENKAVDLDKERHQSAFTWFLHSIMETYSLHNTEETVRLICQGMSEEVGGSSGNLKNHVLSTMVHVGKYGNRNCVASIFIELKKQMSVYWSLPQPLTYHCLKAIRKSLSLRPKKDLLSQESISTSSSSTEASSTLSSYQLNLPSRIMSYLELN